MDPPPVLALATDVVQFTHFTAKKCRSVQMLYESEDRALIDEIAFERTAAVLSRFSALLKQRRKFNHRLSRSTEANERSIGKLADECSGVAKEASAIFKKLDDIHRKNYAISKTLASMRAAWKHEDTAHLIDLMQAYQNQLALRLLQYLNATTGIAGETKRPKFEDIEHDSKIVELLTVSENKLDLVTQQGSFSHLERMGDTDTIGISHHEKTLAVILVLENGDTRVIASKETPRPIFENTPQTLMRVRLKTIPTEESVSIKNFKPIQDTVLRCLYFRSYSDRVESIKPRHKSTFEWVFQPPKVGDTRRTPFMAWLEEGDGCYWINGNAGSGKSTLMKTILNDPRTTKGLKKWATQGDLELVTGDFFFWSLGSRLQRSQHGLMRSLLYSILLKRPHLISVVMPELWFSGASNKKDGTIAAPSFSELLQWFRRLLDVATTRYRLFFLIDGLDEYEGDFSNLTELIKSASANKNVKFLVSSRPSEAFFDTFSSFPGFRLQDYSRNDIYNYVAKHLQRLLKSHDEPGWKTIVEQIVDKSSGCFLWATLVIQLLQTGLLNYDTLTALSRRLNQLPSDLNGLYAAMLNQMSKANRKRASELFQIALLALDTQRERGPLTPLQMHFATLGDSEVSKAEIESIPIQEEKRLGDLIKKTLRSQCAGILEVQSINYRMEGLLSPSIFKHRIVGFVHRTAVEFLRTPEIWDVLLRLTDGTAFNPAGNLCRSAIMLCKTAPVERTIKIDESALWYFMDSAMRYASMAESQKHIVAPECIQELDRAVSHRWERASYYSYGSQSQSTKGAHWTIAYKLGSENVEYNKDHLAVLLAPAAIPLCFHSLAVFHCLTSFLESVPADPKAGPAGSQAARLLHDATRNLLFDRPWPDRKAMTLRCAKISHLLLKQGADPNAKFGSSQESAWDLMLKFGVKQVAKKYQFRRQFHREGLAYHFSNLLVAFVQHNADVNNSVLHHETRSDKGGKSEEVFYSAFKVIDLLFSDTEGADEVPEPLSPSSYSEAEAHSPEMMTIYDNLKKLMSQKGAVAETYTESHAMQWDAPEKDDNGKWWAKVKKAKRRSLRVWMKKK